MFRMVSKVKLETLMKIAFGVTAACMLMGADTQGCNNVDTAPTEEPPAQQFCEPGWHLDLIRQPGCDGGDHTGPALPETYEPVGPDIPTAPPPDGCDEVCVPNSPCPEGFFPAEILRGLGRGRRRAGAGMQRARLSRATAATAGASALGG